MSTARSSVIPDLIDALVALGDSLLVDVTTTDGLPLASNPGSYFAVGVDDPGVTHAATSAQSTADWAGASLANGMNEAGGVTCAAWATRGDGDPKAARDDVFAIHTALLAYTRTHVGLGVPGVWSTWIGGADEFVQIQDEGGASAILRFTFNFKARI